MIENILPDVYLLRVPLPKNPLKETNSYFIKGKDRYLIIDTGLNRKKCKEVFLAGVKELGVDLKKADFFITHLHADHMGLISELATDTSQVYFNEPDNRILKDTNYWENASRFARIHGFPEEELSLAIEKHPAYRYSATEYPDFIFLEEGDTLEIGNYRFSCLETPGHSQGSMCLYEPSQKILVSGDHILYDITPNISLWNDERDALAEYLKSLDKMDEFDVGLILPGHRSIFTDCQSRVEGLKQHHRVRLNEIVDILADENKNAYQIASRMSWDLTYKAWSQFPIPQKWFATGEALAHLKYLLGQKILYQETKDGVISYGLA